jgi:hypothetical protein
VQGEVADALSWDRAADVSSYISQVPFYLPGNLHILLIAQPFIELD